MDQSPQPPDGQDVSAKPTLAYSLTAEGLRKRDQRIKREENKRRIAERRDKVYQLKLAGASFMQIGKQLGVSDVQALYDYRHVSKALAQLRLEKNDEIRNLIVSRYERMVMGLWPLALSGDTDAAEQVREILKEECKIFGLYAPVKFASTTPDGTQWAPLQLALKHLSTEELLLLEKVRATRLLPSASAQPDAIEAEVTNVLEPSLVGR